MLLSSLSSFPLCFSLGKQLNFGVCISEMRQKDCQVNYTTPNYFFTLLLNQFEIPTNLIFFPIFLPFQLFLFASYLLLHVSMAFRDKNLFVGPKVILKFIFELIAKNHPKFWGTYTLYLKL
jgi:hypothetical protein